MRCFSTLLGIWLLLQVVPALAGPLRHSFRITESASPQTLFQRTSARTASLKFKWTVLGDLPDSIQTTLLRGIDYDPNSIVLFARSQFLLSKPLDRFSETYFLNAKLLGTLSGMKHKNTEIENVFEVKYRPAPFLLIRSESTVSFPAISSESPVFGNQKDAEFFVDISFYDFSGYLHQANSLWSFSTFQDFSKVEMLSLAVLRWTHMKSFKRKIAKDAIEKNLKVQFKKTVKTLER